MSDAFFESISNGDLPTVVALGGEERVFVDEAIDILRKRCLSGGMADFNHDRKSAKDTSASEVIALAKTLPVMAPRRLVEVRDCETWNQEATETLKKYLDNPVPETTVLLLFSKLDFTKSVPKLLKKRALCARFQHPKDWEVARIVASRARAFGVVLEHDVSEGLAFTVGTDLSLLQRAFEKLKLAVGDRPITLADVSEHVSDTHLEDAFTLGQAIAEGERNRALRSMAALQANRDVPLRLLGLVAWKLRQVYRARAMLDEGRSEGEISSALKTRGNRLPELMRAAKRFDLRNHGKRLARLAFVDRALKRAGGEPWLWMERMVLELCPPPRRSSRSPRPR